jgi:hypothetical protein
MRVMLDSKRNRRERDRMRSEGRRLIRWEDLISIVTNWVIVRTHADSVASIYFRE